MTDFHIRAHAKRAKFLAAKDKSHFVLEVECSDNRQIELVFPASFAQDLLEQVQNLAARFPTAQTHKPGTTQ